MKGEAGMKTIAQLQVAYYSPTQHETIHMNRLKSLSGSLKGIDILLTNDWARGVLNLIE